MTAYFTPNGFPNQISDNGSPAASYVLHAFLAGTSTPTNMFTDNSGTPAGTTIELDAQGYVSTSGTRHPIWLDTSLTYDIELRDSGDVNVIWTAENISNAIVSTGIDFRLANVAALRASTFIPNGFYVETAEHTSGYGYQGGNTYLIRAVTGSTDDNGSVIKLNNGSQEAFATFSGQPNLKQWGARGNGSTDDTTALQNAIDYVNTNSLGNLLVPPGTYMSDGVILKDHVMLIGEGKRRSIIKLNNSSNEHVIRTLNFDSLTGTNPSTGDIGQRNFGIKFIGIDGNGSNQSVAHNGIAIYGFDYQIEEIEVYSCSDIGIYTEASSATNSNVDRNLQPSIRNIDVHDNTNGNFYFNGQSDCTILDVMAYVTGGTGSGEFNFKLGSKANNTRVIGLHVFGTSDYGVINNASRPQFYACTSESSAVSKVWSTTAIIWIGGRIFEVGSNNSASGFKLDAGYNTVIGVFASEIDGGLIDLSAGGSAGIDSTIQIDGFTNQVGATLYAGTIPASSEVKLNLDGSTDTALFQERSGKRHSRTSKGSDVASAATMTLGNDGNYFVITGTTTITNITTTGWLSGDRIVLQLSDSISMTHAAGGSGQLFLSGSTNLTAAGTVGDMIEFILDAGNWREISRTLR